MWFEDVEQEKYRFERKFLVPEMNTAELEMVIKVNSSFFREVYYQRQINNIYYDFPSLENYWANVDGQSHRTKVRIRWYGDTFGRVENPVLEFKIKKGLLGLKPSYKLKPFSINEDFQADQLPPLLLTSDLPEHIKIGLGELTPTLINRYKRRYFVSANGKLRLTLDWDMEFFAVKKNKETPVRSVLLPYSLLELKYSFEDNLVAQKVSQEFPFRMTKNSKYVEGIDHLKQVYLFH